MFCITKVASTTHTRIDLIDDFIAQCAALASGTTVEHGHSEWPCSTVLHVMLVVLLRILSVLKGAWELSRALGGKTQYKRLQRSSVNVQLAVSTEDSALDKSITKLGHYSATPCQ